VLFRSRISELGDGKQKFLRTCLPQKWRRLITSQFHDTVQLGANAGRDKVLDKLKQHYYFKNMAPYVSAYIESCHICQTVKSPKSMPKGHLGVIEAKFPLDLVSIDIWFPGTTSTSMNTCVLTVIDGFSKWAKAIPLPDHKAQTVAKALFDTFADIGFPHRLHSDCAQEFIGEVLTAMHSLFGTSPSRTTAYNHQGNAYAERLHQYFKQAVASFVQLDHTRWDQYLRPLMMCYNDAFHSALGCAPNEVLLGRKVLLKPIEWIDAPVDMDMTQATFVQRLQVILARTHALVYDKIQAKENRNITASLNTTQTKFEVGQEVMVYRPKRKDGDSIKLSPDWLGPYVVTRVLNNYKVYYLKNTDGEHLAYPVSVLHLKPYIRRKNAEGEEEHVSTTLPSNNDLIDQPSLLLDTYDEEETFVLPTSSKDPEEQEILETLQPGVQQSTRDERGQRKTKKVNVTVLDHRSAQAKRKV